MWLLSDLIRVKGRFFEEWQYPTMTIGKSFLIILCLFSLSWVGVVLNWVSWDKENARRRSLPPDMSSLIVAAVSCVSAVTVGLSMLLFWGDRDAPLALASGLGAGLLIFAVARVQLGKR
jgi:high-affinity Fe2+/Pb2+ permease